MLNDSTLICRILICFHYFFQLRNGGGGGEVDPKRLGEVGERSSSLRLTPPGCGTLDSRKDPAAGMITRRFTFYDGLSSDSVVPQEGSHEKRSTYKYLVTRGHGKLRLPR